MSIASEGPQTPKLRLPDFYILGAQRCGTTWLAVTLAQHPHIFIPRVKEIHFFNDDQSYQRGPIWYASHFAGAADRLAVGEATPNYLAVTYSAQYAQVIERVRLLTPEAKFILTLRNPVTRAISSFFHLIRIGIIPARTDPDKFLDDLLKADRDPYGVLEFGRYSDQIRRFQEMFPTQRFRFLLYERDIIRDCESTLAGLCRFLGVNDSFRFRSLSRRMNPGLRTRLGLLVSRIPPNELWASIAAYLERSGMGQRLTVSIETRRRLAEYYESSNADLASLLSWDLSLWQER